MKTISLGGASGYWGDAANATAQLLSDDALDYLVYDYLAEVTLSIMARARARDPQAGYAVDFLSDAMAPNLVEIASRGIKVVSNAGGMNPQACAQALRALIAKQGLDLVVATVHGDDLVDRLDLLHSQRELFSDEPFPSAERVLSANAYLGAFPIASALNGGADIVITGRVVDSAVTLGPCIAAFGWGMQDYAHLAQGSLAGHLLECGVQATGGNFTDWRHVPGPLEHLGYPIARMEANGNFAITKPAGTAGLVSTATIAEQLVYEIHDPQRYVLPDVVCDFSQVRLAQENESTVRVCGARGFQAPEQYKVSVTFADGYKAGMSLAFIGHEAAEKARYFGEAALAATEQALRRAQLPPLVEHSLECLGAGSQFGHDDTSRPGGGAAGGSEIQLNLAVKHADKAGAGLFVKTVTGLGLAAPAGMALFQSGRPRPSPVVRLFSCLVDKAILPITVSDEAGAQPWVPDSFGGRLAEVASPPAYARELRLQRPPASDLVKRPLRELAWGRSGDKGDLANVGIIARKPEHLPWIWHALTSERVMEVFAHFNPSHVERFVLPGMYAMNLVLHQVLGGGGMASLRSDAQGKAYAQILLDQTISVPTHLAESV